MKRTATPTTKTVTLISLGCSKNLIDSERLMAQLKASNIRVSHDNYDPRSEIVVVNTCGFIGDAKEESIDTILNYAKEKRRGKIKKLYVMGCLSERYRDELAASIPEVDHFYGKFDWSGLVAELGATFRRDMLSERTISTPEHYAYFKISEGCNRMCSYCAIPLITGRHTSRPMDELLREAQNLARQGVRELQVIAQDLSSYGIDLYHESRLAELIGRLSEIDGIDWIRLHYAYPADFPHNILKIMAENPKVCRYLDLALQHISDNMLTKMRRHITKQQTLDLLQEIRSQVPDIHIRTTLITGHPGETGEDFDELMEFVVSQRFERLGVFPYSHEEDTYSWKHYTDDVPDETKALRAEKIMEAQREISAEINRRKVGTTLRVITDRTEDDKIIGRTEFDSPEVDPEVVIEQTENQRIEVGQFYNVKITSADDYDIFGRVE